MKPTPNAERAAVRVVLRLHRWMVRGGSTSLVFSDAGRRLLIDTFRVGARLSRLKRKKRR